MSAAVTNGRDRLRALLDEALETDDYHAYNAALQQASALAETDPDALYEVVESMKGGRAALAGALNTAKVKLAGVTAQMGACTLALGSPVEPEARPDLARGGPAGEIALASLHLIRYAGDVVPLDPNEIAAAIDHPDGDPDFASYPAVFAAAVAHLHTAAYYILEAHDAHAALASEPPQRETFPPLPFPRIWIEMAHLEPYMRFRYDTDRERNAKWQQLDVLGVGIAEIQQGQVWDLYLPFNFSTDPEFFFLAGRITPEAIVSFDPTLSAAPHAFMLIRNLAVGGVHLITARNVTTTETALPRHQRKRLPAALKGWQPKLYYVDLASAGEHHTGAAEGKREYHVRWLVRGHWRHTDHGRTFCTCCDPPQIASWVEPYIKGPIGAPWKGRQVRRTDA